MSKPTREAMVEWANDVSDTMEDSLKVRGYVTMSFNEEDLSTLKAIREALEKPKVSREWIREMANNLYDSELYQALDYQIWLEARLPELGIEVKD